MKEPITTMTEDPIQVSVEAVLSSKGVNLPRWVVRRIEKLIFQDRLNDMLLAAYPKRGADFCRTVLEYLDVKINVLHGERMPSPDDRRVIFVSNHPLGGLDGMALIDFISEYYGCEPRFVVNDMLMAIDPLRDVFLPINKHGSQSRQSASAIDQAMAADVPVIIFPAGLCSRRRGGRVADLQWRKMFVQKAREFSRTIVPLRFEGENSLKFYRLARLRERLGIKLNIEMALLPGEMFKAEGKTFSIICGEPIASSTLSDDVKAEALRIRRIVDNLKNETS